ncbi:transposable element Tcb2 transposase [Trichonephila clavipes]|nr:transposable element Tcb2 transposase [Trichonephila clavipes]
MDDNARPHRTLAVEELLESEDITRIDWTAYSPDLNPIEHVLDALGRCIAARLHHPENTQQLKQMLIEEWVLLPQEMLHQLVLSMRRRCEATIAHQDGRIERTLTACIRHRHTGPSPGVMIWGAIGYTARSPLVCTDCTLSTRLPDLSSIENDWFMVAERLTGHHTPVTSVDELRHRVEAAWASLPEYAFQSLFDKNAHVYKCCYYCPRPQTLDHLEDNIRRVIADIRQQMVEKVIENWTSRLDYIRARHGSHMPDIIFKM